MSTRRQLIHPMLAGVIAGAVIAFIVGVMAWININFAAPWSSTHTMVARVTDADGIGVSSDVRIAGRLVGQITQVHSRGQYTEVTFHIDGSEWPLPDDSTASIRLATLLGQKYLQVNPGHSGSMYQDGATLVETRDVVDFDQILDTFDKPTRTALTDVVKTLAGGVQGQQGTIQQLLPDLRDLSQHSTTGTGELAKRDPELNNILANLGTTADRLSRSSTDLVGVFDNLNSIQGALAANQDALRGFIRFGDQVNQTTHTVLGNGGAARLAGGLQVLDPLARQADRVFTDVIPQTQDFTQKAQAATINLIYEIGDAISQGDKDGYFLRQNLQSVDPTGLLPKAPASSNGAKSGGILPGIQPPLGGLPLPPLPPLPGGTSGGGSGSGGGILPLPTPPPIGINGVSDGTSGWSSAAESLASFSLWGGWS